MPLFDCSMSSRQGLSLGFYAICLKGRAYASKLQLEVSTCRANVHEIPHDASGSIQPADARQFRSDDSESDIPTSNSIVCRDTTCRDRAGPPLCPSDAAAR